MPWGAPPGAWCLLEAPHLASCGRPATSSLQPCLFGQKFAHGGAEIFQPRGRLQHRSQLWVCGEQPGPYPRPELLHPFGGAGELGVTPAPPMHLGKQRPCKMGLARNCWRTASSSWDGKRKSAVPGEDM